MRKRNMEGCGRNEVNGEMRQREGGQLYQKQRAPHYCTTHYLLYVRGGHPLVVLRVTLFMVIPTPRTSMTKQAAPSQ